MDRRVNFEESIESEIFSSFQVEHSTISTEKVHRTSDIGISLGIEDRMDTLGHFSEAAAVSLSESKLDTMTADPDIYMTPQLAKRKDGLCPSLLSDDFGITTNNRGKSSHAAISRSYQTNTKFLTEAIRELDNDAEELNYIVESIHNRLEAFVKRSSDVVSVKFVPKGCLWKLELNKKLEAPDYRLQVVCLAKAAENNRTTYVVDTKLVGKSSKSISSTSLPGFKEAKATLESTALVVRKAVVKCEFPEFPEGCKDRTFREVYQLNARVRNISIVIVTKTILLRFHRLTWILLLIVS